MTLALHIFAVAAVGLGLLCFLAGTIGLLRLPDTLSRLHALTKADNLGLGLVVIGLLPLAVGQGGLPDGLLAGAKMLGIWLLLQVSAGAVAQLMAEVAQRTETEDAP